MTEFYVIMLKRQDGKVYADLHKTNQVIYLTIEDAYEELNNTEHFKENYHIVKLIACLDDLKKWDMIEPTNTSVTLMKRTEHKSISQNTETSIFIFVKKFVIL